MIVVREDVIAAIKDANVVTDVSKIRDDIKLTDQGIDSLGIFNVILVLQEKYQIEISDAEVDQLTNVEQILKYLNHRLG